MRYLLAFLILSIRIVLYSKSLPEGRTSEKLIIAHRGGIEYFPENTLQAFKNAVQMGVDFIEFDVRITSDSISVVVHDDSLANVTNIIEVFGKNCPVKELTYSQIKELFIDGGSGLCNGWKPEFRKLFKIPTFEEVVETVRNDKVKLFIDIKDFSKKTLAILKAF